MPKSLEIKNAINYQIQNGKYASSNLYGDGNAGAKIAEIISREKEFQTQKIISY